MQVAAIVVTYNRLHLLKVCVDFLKKQTYKIDKIIIVNNGSTDGTFEWLLNQNDIIVINQDNSGSSGGQYTGIKYAYDNGYDWYWCMDDDGRPDVNCLKLLISDSSLIKNCGAIGPTVLAIEDNSKLAFDHVDKENNLITSFSDLKKLSDINGIIYDRVNFFNGVLISREAVTISGLPKKDMFIWGDEIEYNARIYSNGMKCLSTINAMFYHPKDRVNYYNQIFFGKLMRIIYNGNPRDYYVYRNHFYVIYKYNGLLTFSYVLFNYLFFNLKNFRIRECFQILKYSFFGITNNFKSMNN